MINYYKLAKELKTLITTKCSILVLTGAGASKESGIDTFRDYNGLWNGHDLNLVCRPESFISNPELVLNFYNKRREQYLDADPNKIHHSLFLLEKSFPKNFNIITQNIDDLHEKAGNKNIWHVHGTLWIDRCHKCGHKKFNKNKIDFPNICQKCASQNMIRPHVVFFKEQPLFSSQIESLVNNSHVFISIGTSGSVYPSAAYGGRVKRNGGITININKEIPKNINDFNYFFKGGSFWVNLVCHLLIKNKR